MKKIIMSAVALLGMTNAQAADNKIDHIIWAVPNFEKAVVDLEKMSGVTADFGAIQSDRGTKNGLLSAGDNTYLEILAPDPAQAPYDAKTNPKVAFASKINQLASAEVDMFAYSTDDINKAKEIGESLGLKVAGPYSGERTIASGEVISWSELEFYGHEFGQFIPFVMNWGTSTHPGKTSPKGSTLKEIIVFHPKAKKLAEIYEALNIPAQVKHGEKPKIVAKFQSEKGEFEITSGESLFQYYAAKDESNF